MKKGTWFADGIWLSVCLIYEYEFKVIYTF